MHYANEELTSYLAMELSEAREMEIEEHLAVCDECTARAREAHLLTSLVQQWTAHAHGEAYRRDLLARALAQLEAHEANPAWRERLRHWRERWAGRAEAAVRVVVAAPGAASRVVTEGLDALLRPGATWQFGAAPAAMPVRGVVAREAAPPPVTVALASGAAPARVAVNDAAREIVARLEALPVGADPREPPFVALIPTTEGAEPRRQPLERRRGATYWVARFADVSAGDYMVVFEPPREEDA
jgi:hypothetical protein